MTYENHLNVRQITTTAFEGEANLGNGTRLEIFLMKETPGWHLGIRLYGYFYFKKETDLDGTYSPAYLAEKIGMREDEAHLLQKLLFMFFAVYRNDVIGLMHLDEQGRFRIGGER